MNKQLILKALCSHRKAKQYSLKNNEKHGRTILLEIRQKEIEEINKAIESLECSIFNVVW